MEFAAREHGFQQISRVHRAVRLARADDGVQLVDEQNDAALALFHFREHRLQTLLEFAPEFRPRNQRAYIQRKHLAVFEGIGDVPPHDTDRQTFRDRRFADARFADQHGVVLRLTRKNADDVSYFLVPADHGIYLVLTRLFHEVGAVFVENVVSIFGVFAVDALIAAHGSHRLHKGVLFDTELFKQLFHRPVRLFGEPVKEMFDGDIAVPHFRRLFFRGVERLRQSRG